MRVFLAGATGAIGRALVPRLIAAGHQVTGMTRTDARAERLMALGADPFVCDVYDAGRLEAGVMDSRPEIVLHELTALPASIDPRKIATELEANDRIRTEGTRNLVEAAKRAGAGRFVAQSIAFAYRPEGGMVKTEEAPLWLDAPWPWRRSVEALATLEDQVLSIPGMDGLVLRYGSLYGPGTAYAPDGAVAGLVRERQFPIAGRGEGVFSFVHVEDAASATVAALTHGAPGVYNVVDDEPAPLREWLPAYAQALGAPAPRRVPGLLARLLAGRYGHYLMTAQRGADNSKARSRLEWTPAFPTWRPGLSVSLNNG
jgi:nucleoside-diphosphate-sugar epimerase